MSLLDKVDNAINLVDKQKFEEKSDDKDSHVLTCYGIDELNALLNKVKSERIFLLFCGNEINGHSWCPDCVAAKPIIQENMKYLNKDTDTFITVYVGEKAEWKDKKNTFRTDARFKVTGVPTLLLYKTQKRLVEAQIKPDMVQMLFEDDDD